MFCPKCGQQNPDDAKFCGYCGFSLVSNETPETTNYNQQPVAAPTTDDSQQPVTTPTTENYQQQADYNQQQVDYNQQGYDQTAYYNQQATTGQTADYSQQNANYNQQNANYSQQPAQNTGYSQQAAAPKQPIPKKYMIAGIIGAAALVLILCISCIAIFSSRRTVNLNKFVVVETSGYEGYGEANVYVDWVAVEQKYGKRLKFTRKAKKELGILYKVTSPVSYIKDAVSVELVASDNLSNGDTIEYRWNVDEDYIKKYVKGKVKFKDKEYKVEGLEEVGTFDAFADLDVSFEGIAPDGRVVLDYKGSDLNSYDFHCETMNGLSNGDKVTVTIPSDDMGSYAERLGKIPAETEKDYEVSGLDEYIASYLDLPDDFINKIKGDAEDTILANFANDDSASVGDLEYAGYSYLTRKEDVYGNAYNIIYIIYRGKVSSSDNRFTAGTVYFPVGFTDILKNDEGVNYNESTGILGNSYVDGKYSTRGYVNPINAYIDIVESNRENYDAECADGFERYEAYEHIESIADIADDYKETLKADALDRIKSYIASDYEEEVSVGELSFKGEYLLVAKDLGTDFAQNNVYYLVFAATVSHSEGEFDTTTVYYPVRYNGVVMLPDDEYMVSSCEGIVGSSDFSDGWYDTRGYIEGTKMYDDLVTANRESYKYEVSDGLKEFGE